LRKGDERLKRRDEEARTSSGLLADCSDDIVQIERGTNARVFPVPVLA
jgi:hypothetical protein